MPPCKRSQRAGIDVRRPQHGSACPRIEADRSVRRRQRAYPEPQRRATQQAEESKRLKQSKNSLSAWQPPLLHEVSMWTRDSKYLFVSPWWAAPKQDGWRRALGHDHEYAAQQGHIPLSFPLISSGPFDSEAHARLALTAAPSATPALPQIKKLKDDGLDAMTEYKAKQEAELNKAKQLRAIRIAKKPSA